MAGVLLGPGPLTKSVAAPYDATATYGVGDHCSKDGKIYICVSAITTAEAWTAAHWERVMVEEEIEDTKKGLAYVEEGTTASQNIAAGSYVWWQGQMCVAASAIAVGDTLSTTNLTIKSTGGLNELNSKFEWEAVSWSDWINTTTYINTTFSWVKKRGKEIMGVIYTPNTSISAKAAIGTVAEAYRPINVCTFSIMNSNLENNGVGWINGTSGIINISTALVDRVAVFSFCYLTA